MSKNRQQRRKQIKEAKKKVMGTLDKLPKGDREPVLRDIDRRLQESDIARLPPEKQEEARQLQRDMAQVDGEVRGKQFRLEEKKVEVEEVKMALRKELADVDTDDISVNKELQKLLADRTNHELDETFVKLPNNDVAILAADDVYGAWLDSRQLKEVVPSDDVVNEVVAKLSKVFCPFIEANRDHPAIEELWKKFGERAEGKNKWEKQEWLLAIGQLYANKYISDRVVANEEADAVNHRLLNLFEKIREGVPPAVTDFIKLLGTTKGFSGAEDRIQNVFFDTRIDWEEDPLNTVVLNKLLNGVSDEYHRLVVREANRDKRILSALSVALNRFGQKEKNAGANISDMADAIAGFLAVIRINRVRDLHLMTEEERKKSLTKEEMFRMTKGAMEKFDEAHPFAIDTTRGALWSDEALTETGVRMWEQTYKQGFNDSEMMHHAGNAARSWGDAAKRNKVEINDTRLGVVEGIIAFSTKWAVHAFQRVTTSHTYAAALMCSDADKAVLGDIELQWHAFMVCIPNGILKYYDDELGVETEYNRVLVASYEQFSSMILLNQLPGRSRNRIVVNVGPTLSDLLDVSPDQMPTKMLHSTEVLQEKETPTQARLGRIVTMAKRLVAGLLLAMQHRDNFKTRDVPARKARSSRERDEPAHRVVMMGIPLKLDCRHEVAKYISHGPGKKGGIPSVQTLVRGHFKRQVIGIGRLGRKVIWIQPFWRGREDAPILTRPKKVGN